MEKMDYMKDALSARRGKGLDIIIGLGREGAPDSQDAESYDSKRSDLAPPPQAMSDQDAPMKSGADLHAPEPSAVISAQHEMAPGDVPSVDDAKAHFAENMSENDLRDMANRKPRSLMERARQHAFEKKK